MEWTDLLEWARVGLFGRADALLRLVLAAALGGMIGLEREASGKPAGFRTNLLICLGAALVMELSVGVAALAEGAVRGDPGRIGAQIVSGIGFLGAGTILHFRGNVTGLTTAATLWVVAAIGMAVGSQAYLEAIGATALVMLTLMLLGRVEDHLIPRPPSERTIDLLLTGEAGVVDRMQHALVRMGFILDTLKVEKQPQGFLVSFHARGDGEAWRRVFHELLEQEAVQKVELSGG
ncbi:MAG TPA: MgtC/SapB family protein [Longimicrobiales bacterium]|nr:MgtC/SapB family protein [Longimicrobiales bacterium]